MQCTFKNNWRVRLQRRLFHPISFISKYEGTGETKWSLENHSGAYQKNLAGYAPVYSREEIKLVFSWVTEWNFTEGNFVAQFELETTLPYLPGLSSYLHAWSIKLYKHQWLWNLSHDHNCTKLDFFAIPSHLQKCTRKTGWTFPCICWPHNSKLTYAHRKHSFRL